jgi:hypothetical protein
MNNLAEAMNEETLRLLEGAVERAHVAAFKAEREFYERKRARDNFKERLRVRACTPRFIDGMDSYFYKPDPRRMVDTVEDSTGFIDGGMTMYQGPAPSYLERCAGIAELRQELKLREMKLTSMTFGTSKK